MPLIPPKKIFKYYVQKKKAVGAFNIYNLETIKAAILAAEKTKQPIILQISERAGKTIGLANFINLIETLAKPSKAQISYHLDHGKDINFIKEAIRLGFPSVMLDGSKLPFQKNVQQTKKIVDFAKKYDVWVEGEIGSVADSEKDAIAYTDPTEAVEFARLTGVDSLAVAIGNIHGIPTHKKIDLNFDVLRRIAQVVKVPLVLHGGSGTPDSQIKKVIQLGIRKININTELKKAYIEAIEDFVEQKRESDDMYELYDMSIEAVRKLVEEKIRLFSL